MQFFTNPHSEAASQCAELQRQGSPAADLIEEIASQPQGIWLTGGGASATAQLAAQEASQAGQIPIFVVYGYPSHQNLASYQSWLAQIVPHIAAVECLVIVEPDGWSKPAAMQHIRYAVQTITSTPGQKRYVYVDAGHHGWMADAVKLQQLHIDLAAGFSVNVSNYVTTRDCVSGARQLAQNVGKGFVIDASRNGRGTAGGSWCNAQGQALGENPRWVGDSFVHALLWIKPPGESDDNGPDCPAGSLPAGQWDETYAEGLVLARRQGIVAWQPTA